MIIAYALPRDYCAAIYQGIVRWSLAINRSGKGIAGCPCIFGARVIALLTNRQIEERSVHRHFVLEKTLVAVLTGMIFLRALDMFSPVPVRDFGCTAKLANRAVVLCAVRDIQR